MKRSLSWLFPVPIVLVGLLLLGFGLSATDRVSPQPQAVERTSQVSEQPGGTSAPDVAHKRRPQSAETIPPPSHYSRRPKSGEQASNRKVSSRFPNILLSTHDGKTVRFYDDLVKDRIVIVNFMYTSCAGT